MAHTFNVQYSNVFNDAPNKHKIRPAMIVDWNPTDDHGWVTKSPSMFHNPMIQAM